MKTLFYVRAIDPSHKTVSSAGEVLYAKTDAYFLTEKAALVDLSRRTSPHIIEEHLLPTEVYNALKKLPKLRD